MTPGQDMTGQQAYNGTAKKKGSNSSIAELEELHRQGKFARNSFESAWYMNLAYYSGYQWRYWNRGQLVEPILEDWRVTFTDNRLIGIVRTEIAKMTKQQPMWSATPLAATQEAGKAALMAERSLRYYWNHLDMQRKQRSVLLWSRIAGAGFWKVYWDSTKGDPFEVALDEKNQPLTDQFGRVIQVDDESRDMVKQSGLKTRVLFPGDVCVEVKSPWELLPDPLATEEGLGEAEWVIDETVKSKDALVRKYGDKAEKLVEDASAMAGLAESRMNLSYNPDGAGGSQYKGVRVKEFWARPSSRYQKGKHCVWAGTTLLLEEDNHYNCLPYVMFSGIPVPGRFWPTSVVEQTRSPQAELNKTRSQIRENAARIGNPSLLVSRYANIEYSGVPGEWVEFDDTLPNSVPSFLQPPEMPMYVREEIPAIENSLREISGQHEVTQGTVPSGVTAASAINLLMEQDDTRLGPDIQDMERSLAEAGNLVLKVIAKYLTEERTMNITGESGLDIFSFRGAMIKEGQKVEVQAGSAMPHSKAAKTAAMMEVANMMIQNGQPLQGPELSAFIKDMGIGGFDTWIGDLTVSDDQIDREHRLLVEQPGPVDPKLQDDDGWHIKRHLEHMRGPIYEEYPAEVKAAFEYHLSKHQERAQQMAQAAKEQEKDVLIETKRDQTMLQIEQLKQQADAAKAQGELQLNAAKAQQDDQIKQRQAEHDAVIKDKNAQHDAQIKQMQAQHDLAIKDKQGQMELAIKAREADHALALKQQEAQAAAQIKVIETQAQGEIERIKGEEARKTEAIKAELAIKVKEMEIEAQMRLEEKKLAQQKELEQQKIKSQEKVGMEQARNQPKQVVQGGGQPSSGSSK